MQCYEFESKNNIALKFCSMFFCHCHKRTEKYSPNNSPRTSFQASFF